jgi:hypothetical protein
VNFDLRQDPRPSVVLTGGRAVREGNAGQVHRVPLEIRKLDGPPATVTVTWRTKDVTAKQGEDYIPASGTVTLTPQVPAVVVFVDVIGDDKFEKPETFDVVLDPVPAYNISVPKTHVSLSDDDWHTGGPGAVN